MNPRLTEIMRNCESRYLNSDEQREILQYTETLPQRFKIASHIEQKEEAIVQSAVDQIKRRYPTFERYHPRAWDKAARDMQLVLRYTVQAMVCDDPDFQGDRLLYWLGTIFHSVGFSPQFNRDSYSFLRDVVKANVPGDAFAMLEPYLEKNIEILGAIPEPAQVLV